MNKLASFSLTVDQFAIVDAILQRFLAAHTQVWVFGSRANGKVRRFSDLDLLMDCHGKPLPGDVLLKMAEAFDASPLPYKVDIVDWNVIPDSFKQHIQGNRLPWLPF